MTGRFVRAKSWALAGAATAALAAPFAARAGEAQADTQVAAADTSVQEVIVTAQRRGQRIVDVPLTVTNTTGQELQALGITSTRELSSAVPGVVLGMKGNFAQPSIRGVSTPGTGPGLESNVSMYLDDIYMPSQTTNVFDLADVERMEVLKGPQGTLFGRNSTGGAIRIFTQEPLFEPGGRISIGYGSYDDWKGSFFATGPLAGDTVAGSISLYAHHNDGYIKDLVRGGRAAPVSSLMGRVKLLAHITSDLKLTATAFAFQNKDATGFAMQPQNGNSLARRFSSTLFVPTDRWSASLNVDPTAKVEAYGGSLKLEYNFDHGTLASMTGGQWGKLTGRFDGDYLNSPTLEYDPNAPEYSVQQEFIYTSKYSGPFNWVGGAFLFYDLARYNPSQAVILGRITDVYSRTITNSYAIFAEGTYDFTDRLSLTAGLRYTQDRKAFAASSVSNLLVPAPRGVLRDLGSTKWHATTPRFIAKYKINSNSNVYASYSTGFTSGSYTPSAALSTPVNPEHIKAFEAGWKTQAPRYSLNLSTFYYKYKDLQVSVVNGLFTAYQNAASAKIYGLDADGSFNVTDDFRIKGGLSLLHARFSDFPNASVNVPLAPATCAATGGVWPCGNQTVAINADGNQLPKAPDFTSSMTGEYRIDAFGGDLRFSGTWYHNSGYPWEVGQRMTQPSYDTIGANVSWSPVSSRYRITAWGRNLTKEKYIQSEFDTAGGDGVVYAAPRWFGVTLDANF